MAALEQPTAPPSPSPSAPPPQGLADDALQSVVQLFFSLWLQLVAGSAATQYFLSACLNAVQVFAASALELAAAIPSQVGAWMGVDPLIIGRASVALMVIMVAMITRSCCCRKHQPTDYTRLRDSNKHGKGAVPESLRKQSAGAMPDERKFTDIEAPRQGVAVFNKSSNLDDMGVQFFPTHEIYRRGANLPFAIVSHVEPTGARRSGELKRGDRVVRINGMLVADGPDAVEKLMTHIGKVTFDVLPRLEGFDLGELPPIYTTGATDSRRTVAGNKKKQRCVVM